MHAIAGKAAALGEGLQPRLQGLCQTVVENAKTLAATLVEGGSTSSPAAPTRT